MSGRRTLAICFAIAVLDGFDAQALAYAAPPLMQAWGMAPGAFAPAFAAGLAGLALGAVLFGIAADRFGRRPTIVAALLLCALGSLATAWAGSFAALVSLRLVTGLGIGGSLPNVIALTAEAMPARRRALAIGTMICGFPLGGFLGGVVAAWLIPAHGWPAVFVLGGAAPLLLAVVAWRGLPESARFLGLPSGLRLQSRAVARLLHAGRAITTGLLWLAFFSNLLGIFLLTSWLPAQLHEAGVQLEQAMLTASLYSLGGIPGSILVTRLMDAIGPIRVLGATLLAGAATTVLMGFAVGDQSRLPLAMLLAGAWTNGAQAGLNALTADLYPTELRATGIGWALGVGRIGAILGPLAGGALIAAGLAPGYLLAVAAAPVMVAGLAVIMLGAGWRSAA